MQCRFDQTLLPQLLLPVTENKFVLLIFLVTHTNTVLERLKSTINMKQTDDFFMRYIRLTQHEPQLP